MKGMFNKFKKSSNADHMDTLIGKNSAFTGDLKSKASVHIEGTIEGNIECEGDCVIAKGGVAHSNISAKNISICGEVKGDVVCRGKLTIFASGLLHGKASTKIFVIEQGGHFEGESTMSSKGTSIKNSDDQADVAEQPSDKAKEEIAQASQRSEQHTKNTKEPGLGKKSTQAS